MYDFNLTELTKVDLNAYGNINIFITKTKYFLFICGSKYGYKLFYTNSIHIEPLKEKFIKTNDISPYMKFSKNLVFTSNLLYTIYEVYGGLYNIDLNEKNLHEVIDTGILKAVRSYMKNRIKHNNCMYSQIINRYIELNNEENELSIHIGPINDKAYNLIIQKPSWEIIRVLVSIPESVFYCNKVTKDKYPFLPSHKVRFVSD